MRVERMNVYTITYPDDIVYLYDNNIINIERTTGDADIVFNVKIVISSPNGEISKLEYTTRSKTISFILDDNLKYLFEKTNDDWRIGVYINDFGHSSSNNNFTFSFKLLAGKSFMNKTHGSANVIYNYTGDEIEIFSPNSGKVVCNGNSVDVVKGVNQINLSDLGIVNSGEYKIELTNKTQYQPVSIIMSVTPVTATSSEIQWQTTEEEPTTIDGGSLWQRKQIYPMDIVLHNNYLCDCDVILRYINCDGCYRQVAGKLLQEEDTFTPTKLNNVISGCNYRYNPNFVNNNNSKILKIGITDIDGDAELGDIIFSEKLQILDINNNWTDCMLKTNSIKNYKNGGFDNLELDIIISEL